VLFCLIFSSSCRIWSHDTQRAKSGTVISVASAGRGCMSPRWTGTRWLFDDEEQQQGRGARNGAGRVCWVRAGTLDAGFLRWRWATRMMVLTPPHLPSSLEPRRKCIAHPRPRAARHCMHLFAIARQAIFRGGQTRNSGQKISHARALTVVKTETFARSDEERSSAMQCR
jgi:hypothetical protein